MFKNLNYGLLSFNYVMQSRTKQRIRLSASNTPETHMLIYVQVYRQLRHLLLQSHERLQVVKLFSHINAIQTIIEKLIIFALGLTLVNTLFKRT